MLRLSNTLVYPCFENINIYSLSAYSVESKLRSVVIKFYSCMLFVLPDK